MSTIKTLRIRTELTKAAQFIQQGELVAFPTETVYGLGADATNEVAVKKVYATKGRPSDNPLIVHVSKPAVVSQYAAMVSTAVKKLMNAFWPGPLTIILPIKPGAFSKTVTGGLATVAFRMPNNEKTRELIDLAGVPLVGPSANTSGKPSPTTADHVLHDLGGKIAAVIDDGPTMIGLESTVIDMSVETPIILRPGAITKAHLSAILGEVLENQGQVGATEIPKAPGMKYKHYAPNAQVIIVQDTTRFDQAVAQFKDETPTLGVMATEQVIDKLATSECSVFGLGQDVNSASAKLFAGLRFFDQDPSVRVILAQGFSLSQVGDAYMNRLIKAAGGQFFN